MHAKSTTRASLSLLLGTPVTDSKGNMRGRLKDVAVATGPAAGAVAGLVLKTKEGSRVVAADQVVQTPAGTLELRDDAVLQSLRGDENFLLLQQDLMDRQIIDVHGRKVVRVNDVDLNWHQDERLRVMEVEVGLRGAVRRMFKGVVPKTSLEGFARRFTPRVIPWEFVDVIEVDPARQVRLKIEHERLAQMHPSDIADILEELAPAEREAVFGSLDEEVAAEALEEVEPRLQKSLIESLDSGRVADIVEEMDPGAAADLLAELTDERSEAILEKMEPAERQEVEELLEFHEDSAAGRMTTEFVRVGADALVGDAVRALREFEGDLENVTEVYLTGDKNALAGVVPVARLAVSMPETRIAVLAEPRMIFCPVDAHQNYVAELFDKYNLHALPVVDSAGRMVGVVQADHVIAFLRER
ncbi:MAG TPA: CBS domain-containing protein [Acidobacteriaceae bacterium]|jgi:sporulation protein YlmC with PRC-barrel domain|nr:CBS domain-containing protein [Acidobacteriaceae bacterium]